MTLMHTILGVNCTMCLQPLYIVKVAQCKLKVSWLLSCIDQDQFPGHTYWGTACMQCFRLLTTTVYHQNTSLQAKGVLTAVMHWPQSRSRPFLIVAQHVCIAASCYSHCRSSISCLPSIAVLTAVMHWPRLLPNHNYWSTPHQCKACKQCCMLLIAIVITTKELQHSCLPCTGVLTAVVHWPSPPPAGGLNYWCTPYWCKACKQCCTLLTVTVTTTIDSSWFSTST